MLETLRHIIQEVNAAEGLNDALQIIVRRVRDAMGTEVRKGGDPGRALGGAYADHAAMSFARYSAGNV